MRVQAGRPIACVAAEAIPGSTGQTNDAGKPILARSSSYMIHLDVKKVGRIPPKGGWRAHGRGTPEAKASTTIGFFYRARTFFAAHGITRLVRVVTDNGANYRARTFTTTITSLASRHQRTRPYTPRHNGKVERYNRIMAEECLHARSYSSEQQRRDAVVVWSHHDNDHRPHTTCGNQPPATRVPAHVTNVMTSYTWVRVSPYPVGVLACFNDGKVLTEGNDD